MNLAATMSLDGAGFLGPLRQIQSGLGGMLGQLSNIGNIASGLQSAIQMGGQLLSVLNQPVRLAAEMESLNAELEVMLGSRDAAAKMVADITEFAKTTPFGQGGLSNAARTLLSFGAAADSVMPSLRMLGDIAGSNQDRFNSLTLAYAQIQSTGKLMGQDLLQLINAGFNPLAEISRTTGRSIADLKKDMEEGRVTADMVTNAFRSATSEGGRFFGNMERQGTTTLGLFATLKDTLDEIWRGMGAPINDALRPILQEATRLAEQLGPLFVDIGTRIGEMVTQAGSVGITLAKGLLGAFNDGQLGSLFALIAEGIGGVLLSSLGVAVSSIIELITAGLLGAFRSALALLSDSNFWDGLRYSAMSIADNIAATLLETVATIIDSLPPALKMGADANAMRGEATAFRYEAAGHQGLAEARFNAIDFQAIMAPLAEAASSVKGILEGAFSELKDIITSNPALREAWAMLEEFARRVEFAAMAADSLTESQTTGKKEDSDVAANVKKIAEPILFGLRDVAADSLSRVGGFIGGTRDAQAEETKRSNMFLERLVRGVTGIDERVSKIKVGWV